MSKLNAGAFSFVPGKSFVPASASAAAAPPPPPLERPPQTEAPAPAPTISLSIGGSKPPPPPAAAPAPAPTPAAAAPSKAPSTTIKIESGPSSKTFSSDRAKTDTLTIAQEVKNAADLAVLEDLFGNSTPSPSPAYFTFI